MIHGDGSPSTAALIDWFELSTKDRSFAEGIGAINLAAEGQVPEISRRSRELSRRTTGFRASKSRFSTCMKSPTAITAMSATTF